MFPSKGTVIIGTVEGDLHDIGKNLVAMMVEGNGYEVIDLGVDVKAEKFEETLEQHPGAFVCMSALLTTTMIHMEKINQLLKDRRRLLIRRSAGSGGNIEQAECLRGEKE